MTRNCRFTHAGAPLGGGPSHGSGAFDATSAAAISHLATRSIGVYRLWRDGGFAVGALIAGVIADLVSIEAATYAVAAITALSGVVVIVRMHETHRPARP